MDRTTRSVTGMACDGCEQTVENALQRLDGVSRVEADHETDTVEIVADEDVQDTEIDTAIEDAGYDLSA